MTPIDAPRPPGASRYSERIGRETVTYVANIYEYYVAYKLVEEEHARREEAKKAVQAGANQAGAD